LIRDIIEASPFRPVIASDMLLWNGVTSPECADLLLDIGKTDATGVLHVPGQYTSRWALCVDVAEWLGVDAKRLRRDDSYVSDRRLASTKWSKLGLRPLDCVKVQLSKMEKPLL